MVLVLIEGSLIKKGGEGRHIPSPSSDFSSDVLDHLIIREGAKVGKINHWLGCHNKLKCQRFFSKDAVCPFCQFPLPAIRKGRVGAKLLFSHHTALNKLNHIRFFI